jgi:NAD(P)-dependent dehydrogenase (short-subunit alcohol dehydrogenase family)
LNLFRTARNLFGPIDIVIANAGISTPQDPFLPVSDSEIEKEFSTKEIDVNLKGCLFTARIGMHFLREEKKGGEKGGDLVLVSSIAGFKESTGLGVYTASKHGVLGLLRGVRVQAEREGVRMNAVCPWMTSEFVISHKRRSYLELLSHAMCV